MVVRFTLTWWPVSDQTGQSVSTLPFLTDVCEFVGNPQPGPDPGRQHCDPERPYPLTLSIWSMVSGRGVLKLSGRNKVRMAVRMVRLPMRM